MVRNTKLNIAKLASNSGVDGVVLLIEALRLLKQRRPHAGDVMRVVRGNGVGMVGRVLWTRGGVVLFFANKTVATKQYISVTPELNLDTDEVRDLLVAYEDEYSKAREVVNASSIPATSD